MGPRETPAAPRGRGNAWSREFTDGWAGVNLDDSKRREVSLAAPPGLRDADGEPAPAEVTPQPHEGVNRR